MRRERQEGREGKREEQHHREAEQGNLNIIELVSMCSVP